MATGAGETIDPTTVVVGTLTATAGTGDATGVVVDAGDGELQQSSPSVRLLLLSGRGVLR